MVSEALPPSLVVAKRKRTLEAKVTHRVQQKLDVELTVAFASASK